ncbi:MAG TPA: SEC59/DGK1/VTE5 family protein [bacterium]|nr:SEC59/DGK1/VTE5 family protein [bacterium]
MAMERIRWARRLYHLLGVPIALLYWWVLGEENRIAAVLILLLFFLGSLALDIMKWRSTSVRQWMTNRLGAIVVPRDMENLNSTTWYLLGCIVTIGLFSAPAAVCGILVLAVGDNAASIVGRLWGRHRIGNKSIEGTAAFLVVGFLAGLPFGLPSAAFASALAGSLAELFIERIDDNLTVPFFAALGYQLVLFL